MAALHTGFVVAGSGRGKRVSRPLVKFSGTSYAPELGPAARPQGPRDHRRQPDREAHGGVGGGAPESDHPGSRDREPRHRDQRQATDEGLEAGFGYRSVDEEWNAMPTDDLEDFVVEIDSEERVMERASTLGR